MASRSLRCPSLAGFLALTVFACGGSGETPSFEAARTADSSIVGGSNTTIQQHPWQVSLQEWGNHFCGGSIIAPTWIVTAQHCIEGQSAGSVKVVAGITRLSGSDGQTRSVARIIPYPGYSDPSYGKDIALLELSNALELNGTTVAAIAPVTSADVSAGLTAGGVLANVSGWGALDENGWNYPDTLQAADVPLVSAQTAQQAYQGAATITSDQLAAGYMGSGDKDSCYGDSGGPLTVNAGGVPKLAGVVSWGYGCGDPSYPGLYARVSSFESWIRGYLPPSAALDAELVSIDAPGADATLCDGSVTPEITLRNAGTAVLTSVLITTRFDGGAAASTPWTGTLQSGAATTVSLPMLQAGVGSHTFEVALSAPNGLADDNASNDAHQSAFEVIDAVGLPLPVSEGFEGSFPPAGWDVASEAPGLEWQRVSSGGFGASTASIAADNYNIDARSQVSQITSPFVDLSNAGSNVELSFSVAYARYSSNEADGLAVFASSDCGGTWSQLYYQSGSALATTAAVQALFQPGSGDWRSDTIDLGAYAGQSSVLLAWLDVNDYGNVIYLDDVVVRDPDVVPVPVDADGDGFSPGDGDCDDSNAATHPGAPELCDDRDNDCNGASDNGLPRTDYRPDLDRDGLGDAAAAPVASCRPLAGLVTNAGDCNDLDAGLGGALATFPTGEGFEDGVPPEGWSVSGAALGASWTQAAAGGFGASSVSATSSGGSIALRTPVIDLSAVEHPVLELSVAYATNDEAGAGGLRVQASSDCGHTWTEVLAKTGADLATAPAPEGELFVPGAADWRRERIDLGELAAAGAGSLVLSFVSFNDRVGNDGGGDALYIDDVMLDELDALPGDGTPGDGTPGDGTPGDGTPGDGTPGDGTPGDGTPGDGGGAGGIDTGGGTLQDPKTPGNGPAGGCNATGTGAPLFAVGVLMVLLSRRRRAG